MTLLLTRLIVAALIAAPILISCPCSSGQENQPYEVAVLDVQKVMDSIEDLPAVDIKAQWDAYKIIQRATGVLAKAKGCLLYTSPSPRDGLLSRMPSSA